MSEFDPRLVRGLTGAVRRAARALAPVVGCGDGDRVDAVAVAALRSALAELPVAGRVVAGEGEKDSAPMLHPGERFGTGLGPQLDIVVDPVDGTRLAARGEPGAMVILAAGPPGCFLDIGPAHYMEKLVCSAAEAGLSLDRSVSDNLVSLASYRECDVTELTVAVQDRPRNENIAREVSRAGARLLPFQHGDIEQSARALAGNIDLLLGIGGAPEGVLEAALARASGGHMQMRYSPQSADEAARIARFGLDTETIFDRDEICPADPIVCIAPITACNFGGLVAQNLHIAETLVENAWVSSERRVPRRSYFC